MNKVYESFSDEAKKVIKEEDIPIPEIIGEIEIPEEKAEQGRRYLEEMAKKMLNK